MSPLEKAAKALWESMMDAGRLPWDRLPRANRDFYIKAARAELRALRPCAEDMERVRAVARKMLHTSPAEVDLIVCAYIDAALEEK